MKWRPRLHREDGASAVEFALVAPILVVLLFGIIQFGFLFFQWLEITHAAREGARWASLRNTEASAIQRVIDSAPGLNPQLTADQIVISPSSTAGNTGLPVSVTVTYPTPLFGPLMQGIFGVESATFDLVSSATQRIE